MAGVTARATEQAGRVGRRAKRDVIAGKQLGDEVFGTSDERAVPLFAFLSMLLGIMKTAASMAVTFLTPSADAHELEAQRMELEARVDTLPIMPEVQMIGGAVITIAVIVIVVNEVLTTNAVANTSGPFDGVIDSLETTGVSAMVLLVVGLLVAAAAALMSFFRGGF